MRPTPLSPSRVEQIVGYLRVFGLVAGVALLLFTDFPDTARRVLAISTVGLLAPVAFGMWWWGRRPDWHPDAMAHVGFGTDVVIITGFVLGFSHLQPNVSWAVVFTLLADAALRYGAVGSVIGLVGGSVMFVAQVQMHASATGREVDSVAYLFVIATLVGIAGVLATFSHVVERQHRAAQEHALVLADAQRLRERLIAISSHELQGSLAAVHLGADTVRMHAEQMTPQQIRTTLDVVVRQSSHLRRLVSELLSVARAHSDVVSLSPTVADVAETIDRALAAAGRHRDDHRVELSAPHALVELDHDRLQQVARNLVENAFKYSPSGGRVLLTAHHHSDVLELRVADSGPGIPAADQEQVFEPFRRRDNGSERADGVGLGLYLVKKIVHAMDGELDLHTTATGSEFVVRLPAVSRSTPPTSAPGPHGAPSD